MSNVLPSMIPATAAFRNVKNLIKTNKISLNTVTLQTCLQRNGWHRRTNNIKVHSAGALTPTMKSRAIKGQRQYRFSSERTVQNRIDFTKVDAFVVAAGPNQ